MKTRPISFRLPERPQRDFRTAIHPVVLAHRPDPTVHVQPAAHLSVQPRLIVLSPSREHDGSGERQPDLAV